MNKTLSVSKFIYILLLTLAAVIICAGSVGLSLFTLISFGTYFSLFFLFFAFSRRKVLALVITSSLIVILQLMNQLKVHYYKERLFFPDLYVAFDPENFATLLHYPSALFYLLLLLFFLLFNIFIFRKEKKIKPLMQFVFLIISGLGFFIIIQVSRQDHLNQTWQTHLPKGRGTISNLYLSANQMVYSPPYYQQGSDYFLQQAKIVSAKLDKTVLTSNKKPDIILFLQESAVNPKLFDINSSKTPEYQIFNQPNSNLMRVQTFGGGTWLTEFSILTGLNTNDFSSRKNAVYYVVAPHVQTSLFNELNNNGYFTVVLSPMGYGNYNAGSAYTHFGMQKFLMPQDLGYPAGKTDNLWKIPTQDLLDKVKQVMETYTDKPLFVFVLSMFEHGPYDENTEDAYLLSSDISDHKFVGRFNDYLSKIDKLNSATLDFITYVKQRNNSTLFVYFGDHQPALGWSGSYKPTISSGDFITQYSMISNYPVSVEKNAITDVSLLSGLILEKAGITDISRFYQANITMRYLCDGKLDDCEDKQLVDSYKHYIYQDLNVADKPTN